MSGFLVEINNGEVQKDGANFSIKNNTNQKFANDKCFFKNNRYVILLDGVVLNKKEILKGSLLSWEEKLISLYKECGDAFYESFRGSFSGAFHDIEEDKWIFFEDHIGSRNMYYSFFEGGLVVSTNIAEIYTAKKEKNTKEVLDVNAAYMLLSYGFMLEDCTLSKGIKKILPGSYLKFKNGQISVHRYYVLNNKTDFSLSEDEAIEKMDQLFIEAIKRQFNKDIEYNLKHFVALSGGLDSRMTTWVAHSQGYNNQLNFTFSQSGYLDETIPKKIAGNLKHEWIFKALDNGVFLKDIEEVTKITGGNVLYYGLAHGLSLYKYINFDQIGIAHSGQLGDVIFGSFTNANEHLHTFSFSDGAYSKKLAEKVQLAKTLTKYENHELFVFNQRALGGANDGLMAIQQFTETLSPFYGVDLLNFALTIPLKYRKNQKIYKKWILKKYPKAADYIWEKTGEKINVPALQIANKEITFRKIIKKTLVKLKLKESGHYSKNNMNPLDYWLKTNQEINDFLYNILKKI